MEEEKKGYFLYFCDNSHRASFMTDMEIPGPFYVFIEPRSLLYLIPVAKRVKVTSSYWPFTPTVGHHATFLPVTNVSSCICYVHFLRPLKVWSMSLVGRAGWTHSVSSIAIECTFYFWQLWKPVFGSKFCRKVSLSVAGELELDNLGFIPIQTILWFY